MKISVVIVTCNSELHLAQTLRQLSDFDELVVCDMGSTDSTLDIARSFGCKVMECDLNPDDTLEDVRNYSLRWVKNEWVLMVEPNELVPPALKDYLYNFIASTDADGLFIPRKNYMMYRFRKGSYPDYRLRLFRRHKTVWDETTGPIPHIEGKVDTIRADRQDLALIHLSTRFVRHMGRHGRANQMETLHQNARKISLLRMLFAPMGTFLNTYLLRGTIFYGKDGFVYACRNATDHFSTLADIHETHRISNFNSRHADSGIEIPIPGEFNK